MFENLSSASVLYDTVTHIMKNGTPGNAAASAYCLAACNAIVSACPVDFRDSMPDSPATIRMPARDLAMCIAALAFASCPGHDPQLNRLFAQLGKTSGGGGAGVNTIQAITEAVLSAIPAGILLGSSNKQAFAQSMASSKSTIKNEMPRLLSNGAALATISLKKGINAFVKSARSWAEGLGSDVLHIVICEGMAWGLLAGDAERRVPSILAVSNTSFLRSFASCMDADVLQRQCALLIGTSPSSGSRMQAAQRQSQPPQSDDFGAQNQDTGPVAARNGPPTRPRSRWLVLSDSASERQRDDDGGGQQQQQRQQQQRPNPPPRNATPVPSLPALSDAEAAKVANMRLEPALVDPKCLSVDSVLLACRHFKPSNRCKIHEGAASCVLQVRVHFAASPELVSVPMPGPDTHTHTHITCKHTCEHCPFAGTNHVRHGQPSIQQRS